MMAGLNITLWRTPCFFLILSGSKSLAEHLHPFNACSDALLEQICWSRYTVAALAFLQSHGLLCSLLNGLNVQQRVPLWMLRT